MNTLILFGVIVAAEVVADKIITRLDERKEARENDGHSTRGVWAVPSARQAGKQDFIDKLVGELTPEQKRYYKLVRDKLRRQTSDTEPDGNPDISEAIAKGWLGRAEGPITQEFGKPPTGWGPPYGHTPFGPPYREQGFLPDYKTYPSRDA